VTPDENGTPWWTPEQEAELQEARARVRAENERNAVRLAHAMRRAMDECIRRES
jgi:hypothetical protein